MSIYFLCLFFKNQIVWGFLLFCILTSYQIHGLQVFLPSYRLPFHFVDFFSVSVQRLLSLMWSHLLIFALFFVLLVSHPKNLC